MWTDRDLHPVTPHGGSNFLKPRGRPVGRLFGTDPFKGGCDLQPPCLHPQSSRPVRGQERREGNGPPGGGTGINCSLISMRCLSSPAYGPRRIRPGSLSPEKGMNSPIRVSSPSDPGAFLAAAKAMHGNACLSTDQLLHHLVHDKQSNTKLGNGYKQQQNEDYL